MATKESFTRVVLYCQFKDQDLAEVFWRKIVSLDFDPPFEKTADNVFEGSMIASLKQINALTQQIRTFLGNPIPPGVKIYLERGKLASDGTPTLDRVTILDS